jgi:hypothetical protein
MRMLQNKWYNNSEDGDCDDDDDEDDEVVVKCGNDGKRQ